MAWSDAARRAAAEARRRRALADAERSARARAAHAGGGAAAQAAGNDQERAVARMLRARAPSGRSTSAVDVQMRRGGRLHGVEVKTLVEQRNDKITVNKYALARKLAFARRERASLHTVAVDVRSGAPRLFYRRGVGSFRLSSMSPVSSAAHLRRLMGIG